MSIRSMWPSEKPAPEKGVARFNVRCEKCDTNDWTACDFDNGIGWACIACGGEDTDHPRVALPKIDRTEEDL